MGVVGDSKWGGFRESDLEVVLRGTEDCILHFHAVEKTTVLSSFDRAKGEQCSPRTYRFSLKQ